MERESCAQIPEESTIRLIAAGISLAIISIVNGIGTNLRTKFTPINASLK
jgi:hypothetical protein